MHAKWIMVAGMFLLLGLISACGAVPAVPVTGISPTMDAMDHGVMPGTAGSDQPFDANFIDGMIIHHEGAITMANQALEAAERPEIRELARAIVSAQQAEIDQLKAWRVAWYPDLAPTAGMAMGTMAVADGDTPFDQRFIEAMIPHHQDAIAMARAAQQQSERPEIQALALAIISAQEAEIVQMRQWLAGWYGIEQ
ncbi:MAG TPA: DUF305 domain-containing protein [Roseiflexaceae bacterium]|nr:DUF305 domain-containing protein [Roseiflexaceae bacterium]HMP41889.1 DUF305 domain-containing protein [Roseiflexaceae bacterium]